MRAQHGQDVFVLAALDGLRDGFFLDSGAADGLISSNTLLLERNFGWNGICVEPNAAYYSQLAKNRRAICLNCCLYDRDTEVDFLEAGPLGGIVSDFDPTHVAFLRTIAAAPASPDGKLETIRKPARSLRSILRECGAPRTIDYWSLDTEGSEFAILKGFPFDEFSFRALTVEHNRLPVREDIRRFLATKGFRRAATFDIDDAYLREDVPIQTHWQSAALRSRLRRRP